MGAFQRAAGEGSGLILSQFIENSIAHLCGGGVGEGNGDNLARLVYFAQQAQEAVGKQGCLARAGRRLHQDGPARIEGAHALKLIGRLGADRSTHRRPPRLLNRPRLPIARRAPECGRGIEARSARRSSAFRAGPPRPFLQENL